MLAVGDFMSRVNRKGVETASIGGKCTLLGAVLLHLRLSKIFGKVLALVS